MSAEDLERLRQGALRPSHELADLAIDHVDFDELAGRRLAEHRLHAGLTGPGDRARIAIIGPSGAGKSSLIARALAQLDNQHAAVVIQVGNAGAALEDPGSFARFVLEELRGQVEGPSSPASARFSPVVCSPSTPAPAGKDRSAPSSASRSFPSRSPPPCRAR